MKPIFSIIVCTYNGLPLLKDCLASLFKQSEKRIEVLCVDGGSTDGTISFLKDYSRKEKRLILIHNKLRLPEGKGYGKWLGYKKARGEFVAFIDQDNILQSSFIFRKARIIFSKEKNIAGILGGLSHDIQDTAVVRYVSLVGTDSFLAYRSADFLRKIQNLKTKKVKNEKYEFMELCKEPLTITGGNCFFYKKEDLKEIGAYDQDILVLKRLVDIGKTAIAIIPEATKHYTEKNLTMLASKKLKWGKSYFNRHEILRFNYFPSTISEYIAFIRNTLFTLTIMPNFYYSFLMWKKSHDSIAFLFPVHAFLTALAYGVSYLNTALFHHE